MKHIRISAVKPKQLGLLFWKCNDDETQKFEPQVRMKTKQRDRSWRGKGGGACADNWRKDSGVAIFTAKM